MFVRYAISRIFTVLGLLGLVLPAYATDIAGISVAPIGVASMQGQCLNSDFMGYTGPAPVVTGLGCAWSSGDPLIDPTTHTIADPVPSGQVENPLWTRDAIYTATGMDPGTLNLLSRVDGFDGNLNGNNGFTLYDVNGTVLLDGETAATNEPSIGNGNYKSGYWSYTGTATLDYLTVKPGSNAFVWDISELILYQDDTIVIGFWEIDTAYALLADPAYPSDLFDSKNEMSHISIYGAEPPPQIPVPPTLWLFTGLAGLLVHRYRKS